MRVQGWTAGLAAALLVAGGTALEAQHPVDGQEFMFENLREKGQPVIPLFDGYFPNPDGSHNLCFGYFNMNLSEIVEIPIGENNSIEPAQFNGMQPTNFLPVPPPPNRYRRFFCAFSVRLPKEFGKEQKVWWTLVQDGREYKVPGHLGSPSYQLEEQIQRSRGSVAPLVRFLPSGPEGVGRSGELKTTMAARVGQPLTLSVAVTRPPKIEAMEVVIEGGDSRDTGPKREWWVKWAKHQGPGEVTFNPSELDVFPGKAQVSTTARFSAPGTYLLRMQAIDSPAEGGSYQFHCCWTNAYVTVNVK